MPENDQFKIRYGIEIPNYEIGNNESLIRCLPLIKKIGNFLEENGAPSFGRWSNKSWSCGMISSGSLEGSNGVVFYGSEKLAQTVADAFPKLVVRGWDTMNWEDVKIIAPSQTPAQKPVQPKKSSGPNF